jgi:hypothetical protein
MGSGSCVCVDYIDNGVVFVWIRLLMDVVCVEQIANGVEFVWIRLVMVLCLGGIDC